MKRTRVGEVEVIALVDAEQAYPATTVYPQAGEALKAYASYLNAEGGLALNFGCYVVRDGTTTVLVDCGLGPAAGGRLASELGAAGVKPESVDLVAFTHLHGDHTGWNLDPETGKARFANARYLVPRGDWDHYRAQEPVPPSFTRDVTPLDALGCLDLIEGQRVLTQAVTALPTPGHTPGHTSYLIASGASRGCILGDVVISPIDTEHPEWQIMFDWNHELARETRARTIDRLCEDGSLVGGSHLPSPGLGHFVAVDGKRKWLPLAP